MTTVKMIGILGAGKLGITLAQLAIKAGYDVSISGSGETKKIALSVEVLAPGAVAMTSEEVTERVDVIVLAFPLSKYRQIPKEKLAGKLVIDATNHWWEVDGSRDDFLRPEESSSEAVQDFLPQSTVVKALNHIGYHDLHDEAKPAGNPGRKAIAVAGDKNAATIVSGIVNQLGFDPLYIGNLSEGRKLEPGGAVFGANVDAKELANLLGV